MLSADAVEKANSGHPGMPMGTADLASLLWVKYLKFNPGEPSWAGRDRFVLSAGHGSMLLYSLLHLFQYDLPLEQLQSFRQWGSITPGHPEFGLTPGVETTTGPLGQGFANGVGLALSEKLLAARYSAELFGGRIFGIVSDGDLMEGISSEAASLAGHLELGNLIYLYDDNHVTIGGSTAVCFTEDVPKRFEAYGWGVQRCDGHDFDEIDQCLQTAIAETHRPSLICARTTIGFGSPNKGGSAAAHGAPLGAEELRKTKEALEWPLDKPFYIPSEVTRFCAEVLKIKVAQYDQWLSNFESWKAQNSDQAKSYESQASGNVPVRLAEILSNEVTQPKPEATRNISGAALQVLSREIPFLIGGSADLEPSNKTLIKGSADLTPSSFEGKNIRFGVREHAMGAIANGLAYTKHWIPYTATFLVFSDYMRPAMRLAALSHLRVLFIFTHDSFWVGEDGPTHEPVEHLWALRMIPNMWLFRPADALETSVAYAQAVERKDGPSCLIFTRQNLPPVKRATNFDLTEIAQGAYVVLGEEVTDLTVVATGSEVGLAIEAAQILHDQGIAARVVSMPCVELFQSLPVERQMEILPPDSKVVTIEAGSTIGWKGLFDRSTLSIGLDHYGASAPAETLAKEFGFNKEVVAQKILHFIQEA